MVKLSRFLPKTEVSVHRCSIKKLFTGKHICKSLFLSNVADLKCYSRPVFFLFPLNIFRANNVHHLHVAISGVPRQLVVTELIYC